MRLWCYFKYVFSSSAIALEGVDPSLCSICTDSCCRGCCHSGWEGLELVAGHGHAVAFVSFVAVWMTSEGGRGWLSQVGHAVEIRKFRGRLNDIRGGWGWLSQVHGGCSDVSWQYLEGWIDMHMGGMWPLEGFFVVAVLVHGAARTRSGVRWLPSDLLDVCCSHGPGGLVFCCFFLVCCYPWRVYHSSG